VIECFHGEYSSRLVLPSQYFPQILKDLPLASIFLKRLTRGVLAKGVLSKGKPQKLEGVLTRGVLTGGVLPKEVLP